MAPVPRFERDRAVRRRRPRAELPRLGDRAAGELGSGDAGREAEVVLDPARRARLPAERGALDDQRVQALGGAVDRRAESRRPAADDQQVDLLARRELAADAERARHLTRRGRAQLRAARQAHDRRRAVVGRLVRHVNGRRLLRAKSSIRIVAADECGPTISRPSPSTVCSASRRAMNVESTRSLSGPSSNSRLAQHVAIDGDVAQRLRHHRRDEDRLPRQQVQLAQEPRRAVADDLLPGPVDDRDLALEDRR